MNRKVCGLFLAFALILCRPATCQIYDTNNEFVQTFAGSGFYGFLDGQGTRTFFYNPNAIVADSHGNIFVWDSNNYRVRKITPGGTVSTFVGGGTTVVFSLSYPGTNATLSPASVGSFRAMTIGHNDTIYLLTSYPLLYTIDTNGIVFGYNTGPTLLYAGGMCVDSSGIIYISDYTGNKIYRMIDGILNWFAGSGNPGFADGNSIFTAFLAPTALAADAANNIYVWDSGNSLIRKIDQGTNVATFAGTLKSGSNADGVGTSAAFNYVGQMCFDNSGDLILACGNSVRKIDPATNVMTMAGFPGISGYTDECAGNLARFNGADGVCFTHGMVFVADSSNQRIRNITFNPQTNVVSGASLGIATYAGVTIAGTVGRTYQIQTSPDMITWSTVQSLLLTSTPYLWIDQNAVIGNKFYRALLLP